MRRLAWMLIVALLALPLPAWAQAVKLGAVVPLTGRYGPGGAQVRAGYEIAVEQINAAGGVTVAGKKTPLELVLLDDESDATKTVARMETLAAQGVIGYLGGCGSDLQQPPDRDALGRRTDRHQRQRRHRRRHRHLPGSGELRSQHLPEAAGRRDVRHRLQLA